MKIKGRIVYRGKCEGEAIVTEDTLAGWGGIDPNTGIVIDKFHELYGTNIKGKILVFRGARGSSGWAGTFHLARLKNTAPAGVIFTELTSKLCLGILVMKCPAVTDLEINPFDVIKTGDYVKIDGDTGEVTIIKNNMEGKNGKQTSNSHE